MILRAAIAVLLLSVALPLGAAEAVRSSSATTPAAQSTPANVKKFAHQCESLTLGSIVQLEYRLRGLKSGALRVSNRQRSIQAVERELDGLRNGRITRIPALRWPLETGAIGRAPGDGGHVEQLLNSNEALVTCYFHDLQVEIKEGRAAVRKQTLPTVVVIRGLSTTDDWEGMDKRLDTPMEVVSTYSYKTESGETKTVPVLAPFDMARLAATSGPTTRTVFKK